MPPNVFPEVRNRARLYRDQKNALHSLKMQCIQLVNNKFWKAFMALYAILCRPSDRLLSTIIQLYACALDSFWRMAHRSQPPVPVTGFSSTQISSKVSGSPFTTSEPEKRTLA